MGRIIAILVAVVVVAVSAYFFLNQRQTSPTTSTTNTPSATSSPADSESAATTNEGAITVSIPEGFEALAFISDDQVQDFSEAKQVIEADVDYVAVLNTSKGSMLIDLFEETPITTNNFVFLALNHYYEGIVFHRVLDDFMAQTGDPTGTGRGGPGYQFEDEFIDGLEHDDKGILSMANSGPNTNGSQFFITFEPTPFLNGRHTVFGKVIEGSEVLDSIQRIDPSQPRVLIEIDQTLADLASEAITLDGDPTQTVEAYLTEALGAAPVQGRSFEIDGYKGVMGMARTASGNVPMYGFDAPPDVIRSVEIYAKR